MNIKSEQFKIVQTANNTFALWINYPADNGVHEVKCLGTVEIELEEAGTASIYVFQTDP